VSPSTRLVLCMIVKNEAAVIRRCLDAALPQVDGYVVCDTGSSDATVAIVKEAAALLDKPGAVFHHDWRDFGHNRTLSARAARGWVQEQGWPLERTYLLFLDADLILNVDGALDRESLSATSYSVAQDDGTLRYYNTRLACLSHEWRAVGVTHEFWEPLGGAAPPPLLEAIWIRDAADGGNRSVKLERDIRLLTEGLREEPGNLRYMFYLAQSFYDTERWSEAASWYERRWAGGGWAEERWYSRYRLGLCLLHMGENERGASMLLEAFEERPTRAEPLHALARHYRERSRNQLALMLARQGLEVAYPRGDTLFVSTPVYAWQLWEEVMISAYYVGARHHALGLDACERLIARRGHPTDFYDYVARNEVFYLPSVRGVRRGAFSVSSALRLRDGVEYLCSNPTVVRIHDRTWVNVRLINYRQEQGRHYTALDPAGVVRTRNVVLEWDPVTANALTERESASGIPAEWAWDTRAQGLEDARWVVHEDQVWLTATCHQVPGCEGNPQVVLGRMNVEMDAVEHLVPLECELAGEVEKNWVPWSLGQGLFLIYSYDPFVVLRVDTRTGRASPVVCQEPSFRSARFRGSTSPVRAPTPTPRWVFLVHEVAHPENGRVYAHRWVEVDEHMALVAFSRPFVFDHRGIEYAAGLCSMDSERLFVTYGSEDREARWIELEWTSVLEALERGA
jgi:glycosyltransferase involved in cell wall biosynthesis